LQPHLDSFLLLHQASTKLERKVKEQEGKKGEKEGTFGGIDEE
jgi:hypothetical protein